MGYIQNEPRENSTSKGKLHLQSKWLYVYKYVLGSCDVPYQMEH